MKTCANCGESEATCTVVEYSRDGSVVLDRWLSCGPCAGFRKAARADEFQVFNTVDLTLVPVVEYVLKGV